MQRGNYQISWCDGPRVATAFDYHPEDGGLNARTNIYYLQTTDFGQTWTTITGQPVETPLVDVHSPALVHDYATEHLLVYLKDLTFDHHGHPVILYLTSRGYASGPAHGPRVWWTTRWTGSDWKRQRIVESDHNYDHGSLYIEPDGVWRLIAPTDPGPQPHTTGGDVVVHVSDDQGCTWRWEGERTVGSGRNQTYVRRPLRAHDDFLAFWADGNPLEPSKSCLYFSTRSGDVYQLPEEMTERWARPRRVG